MARSPLRVAPDQLTPDDTRPMREIACRRCATTVLVRKSAPTQTSIQWLGDSGSCSELAERRAAGEPTGRVATCRALTESIDEAVREGVLQVLDA